MGREIAERLQRGAGDGGERFTGEERLMARDQNVWQRQQPGENIVDDQSVRPVLVEELGFILIDIEPEVTDLAGQ